MPSENDLPSLNPEDEELRAMMRAYTPPFDEQPPSSSVAGPSPGRSPERDLPPASGLIRLNEQRAARRFAERLSLKPYQKQALDELATSSNVLQNLRIYAQQCVVENKLDKMILEQPPYTVGIALKTNIKSVTVAVLLSSKLSAYKGDIPKHKVLACILRDRLHIPPTYDLDTYMSNIISTCIANVLVQVRSDIKKDIKKSIAGNQTNFDLATKLVKDTKCTVTVPLCGKIAILRKVYTKDSGTHFWDKVDTYLANIRVVANNDPLLVARAIKGHLTNDKFQYGSNPSDTTAPEQLNVWQQGIDDLLTERSEPST